MKKVKEIYVPEDTLCTIKVKHYIELLRKANAYDKIIHTIQQEGSKNGNTRL